MKIHSVNDYVVLKILKIEKESSGVYKGKEESKIKYIVESPKTFRVLVSEFPHTIERIISVGDSVLFEKEKGHLNGDFVLVKKEHIIGVVEEESKNE